MAVRFAALLVTSLLALGAPASAAAAQPLTWRQALHVPGVLDVGGPMPGGRLVVAGSKGLFLVAPGQTTQAYATQYTGDSGEAYLAVSPGLAVSGAGCRFAPGDVFVLWLAKSGVLRIDAQGQVSTFATFPGLGSPDGIAFDGTGGFGHRLLVTIPGDHTTTVVALDCRGRQAVITRTAPIMEGGLAVAPSGFGEFGGDLVAPDELGGAIAAVRPDGSTVTVAASGLPAGQDVGVESLGFVPPGFGPAGAAYMADRATSNNPHPGTDSLLELTGPQLRAAGVAPGDLLAATEGGALAIDVRCAPGCAVRQIGAGPRVAHGEGHLLVLDRSVEGSLGAAPGTGREAAAGLASLSWAWLAGSVIVLLAVLAMAVVGVWRRRRPATKGVRPGP